MFSRNYPYSNKPPEWHELIITTIIGLALMALLLSLGCKPEKDWDDGKVWREYRTPVTEDQPCKDPYYWSRVDRLTGERFAYEYRCEGSWHIELKYKDPSETDGQSSSPAR